MSVKNPAKVKKVNRSRRLGAAIAPCFDVLENRVMMSFTAGDLVIDQVGSGTTAGSSVATAAYLAEYNPSTAGQTAPVLLVDLATAGTNPLTDSGSATSEGQLTLSPNGQYLAVPGYDAAVGTSGIASSAPTSDPREVDLLGNSGSVSSQLTSTAFYYENNIRGAATDGTGDVWASGTATSSTYASTAGVNYFGTNGAPTNVEYTTSTQGYNTRVVNVLDVNGTDQLYYSTGSGTAGVYVVGTGTPTTSGQTATLLVADHASSGSPYAFSISPNGETIYIADSDTLAAGGGIQKYTSTTGAPGSFTYQYTLGSFGSETAGEYGLTVDWSNPSTPVIYGVTSDSAGAQSLIQVVDNGSAASSTYTTLATNSGQSGDLWHGVAFAPAASTPTITVNSVMVNPTAIASAGTNITLSASVSESGGNTPTSVTFYLEATNGTQSPSTDTPYTGATDDDGTWTLSGVSTTGLSAGQYTYYAVASDSNNDISSSGSPTASLVVGQPTIASVSASPATTAVGQTTTLTAVNVAAASSADPINNVTFYIEKTSGTENPTADYDLGAGTAGGSNYTLSYTPISNSLAGGNYTIYAIATTNAGVKSTGPTATLNVTTPTIALLPAYYTGTVPSGGGNVTLTVTRTGDTTDPVTVNYATSNGTSDANALDATAVAGTDYTTETGQVSFGLNQSSATFTIPILQPNTGIGDKVFSVTFSSPTEDGTITGSGAAAVLINQTPRAFTAGDAVVEVGGNGATPISASNGANTIYLYEYNSSGGLVQAFPLPNTQTGSQTAGSNRPLMAGDSGFEGLVGNSLDGQNVLIGGYDGTTTGDYSFGLVDSSGDINTTTGINSSVSLSVVRGLATYDEQSLYWTSSSGTYGLQEINVGSVASQANAVNVHLGTPRALTMDANGDLFSDTTTSGTGYVDYDPTSGNAPVGLPGFTSSNAGACTQFGFASNVTEDDTIYLQDGGGPSSIEKFSLTGTNSNGTPITLAEEVNEINNGQTVTGMWVLDSSTLLPSSAEGLGVTVDQISPTQVQIYDTLAPFSITGASGTGSSLYTLTDTLNLTSPTPVSGTLSTIATLPGNTGTGGGSSTTSTAEYHCVANAPVAAGVSETTLPQSQTVSNGQTVTFTAWAGQQNEPSTVLGTNVQWYEIVPGSSTPTELYGQTWTTLTVNATADLNGAQYYAVFTNNFTSASDGSENVATLTVNDAPYITNVSPNAGPLGGGVAVTLTGNNFISGSTVSLAGIPGTITPTSITTTSLTFVAPGPETAGSYDVQVTDSNGESPATASETFTYLAGPTVTSISPTTGPDGGGTTVTINGTGFVSGATVTFGGVPATSVTYVSPIELTAVTPATGTPAATVDTVVSETISGTSLPSPTSGDDKFTYQLGTVAAADASTDNTDVLLDNNAIVTAITQNIGTFDGDEYSTEQFLLDDGTASIMAVATQAQLTSLGYTPTVGDELKIAGQFSEDSFPLVPQLVNISSITVLASGQPLPANYDPTINVLTASTNPVPIPTLAAQVVTLTGATINGLPATGAIFGAGNLTYNISDSSDPYTPANGTTPASGGMELYYAPSQIGISVENLAGLPIPTGDDVTITGIIQNYYGVNEFCPISIPGNSERFSLTTTQNNGPLTSDKNANAVTDGFSSVDRGSSFTITVNRLETVPTGGTADTGTVNLVLAADTGVAGTDFSVAGYTPSNGTITIPVSFAPGATTVTFTVTTSAAAGANGSKLFTISLADPASSNPGGPTNPLGFDVSTITNPQTIVIEDTSPNQYDQFASISSGALQSELANVEATQVTGSDALNVESAAQGQYADYAIMTFDDSAFDPTDILNNPSETIETINGLQLEALPTKNGFDAAGTLNVYIITDTYVIGAGMTYPTTGLSFNSDYTNGIGTADPATGIISDAAGLGTLYPLGSIAYDPTQVVYGSENVFNLTTLNSIGTQLLASDIADGTPITIVIAPGDGNVAASFAGWVNTNQVQQTAPNLRIQYSTVLPSWVIAGNGDANSQTVFIAPTNALTVTDSATIIADPAAYNNLPAVQVVGPTAQLSINTTANGLVHLASLSLSGGAKASIASLSAPQVVVIAPAATPTLDIDSASQLDLGNNILDLQNGIGSATDSQLLSLVTSDVTLGYNNGLWNGDGIDSSTAASDPTHLFAVGVAPGADLAGSIPGFTPGAFDVLVSQTYYGDANVDGKVDASDYSKIDNGYLNQLTGWFNGDFNYDGVINGSDYTLIDNAFNMQGGALPLAQPASNASTKGAALAAFNPTAFSNLQVNPDAQISDLLKHDKSNLLTTSSDVLDELNM